MMNLPPRATGSGSTGDFTVHAQNFNSGGAWASRYSATDFTFAPSAPQFHFGSLNDKAVFDNNFIVPEPSSLLLAVLGPMGFGLLRRRRALA